MAESSSEFRISMTMLQPLGRGQRVVYYFVDQWEVGSFDDRSVQFRLSYNAVRIVSLQHYIRLGSVRFPLQRFHQITQPTKSFATRFFRHCNAKRVILIKIDATRVQAKPLIFHTVR